MRSLNAQPLRVIWSVHVFGDIYWVGERADTDRNEPTPTDLFLVRSDPNSAKLSREIAISRGRFGSNPP
jgi:hypothetical protein